MPSIRRPCLAQGSLSTTSRATSSFKSERLRSRTREPPPGQVDFGGSVHFLKVFGNGTGPKRFGTTVGFIWVDSHALATILDPFWTIFADLGPDTLIWDLNIVTLPQWRFLRLQHCALRHVRCLFLRQKTSVLSQQQTSVLSQQ